MVCLECYGRRRLFPPGMYRYTKRGFLETPRTRNAETCTVDDPSAHEWRMREIVSLPSPTRNTCIYVVKYAEQPTGGPFDRPATPAGRSATRARYRLKFILRWLFRGILRFHHKKKLQLLTRQLPESAGPFFSGCLPSAFHSTVARAPPLQAIANAARRETEFFFQFLLRRAI